MLRVDLTFGNVAHVVLDQAHAHERRRLPDSADAPRLLDDDLPDLLCGPRPFLVLHAERAPEHVEGAQHFRVVRLLARRPVRRIPLRERHSHVGFRGVDRQCMPRKEEQHFGAVVGPGDDLILVAGVTRESKIALELLDVDVDADLLPLLLDHLPDCRVRHELRAHRHHLQAEPALAVDALAIAVAVFFGQADLVEQFVALLHVEHAPLLVPFGPRAVEGVGSRRNGAGATHAEPERFVELVAIDAERERMAEILVAQPLHDLGVTLVRVADVQRDVRTVEARIEMHGVVALLRVFQKHRQLGQVHMAFLDVVLAGDGAQVRDLAVLRQRHRDAIDVRQLVARGVDRPEIRIALH